ncbi:MULTISPECIES: Invasion protein B family [Pseudomonas]|uniref:Invasion protein n=1 Tax=Pseudomonas izuensis TaxID=2684212 RepID=A0ABM7RMD4_9PSED|nr:MULTISPECIES: Invasion protein B family [Pseudomonas]RKS28781.1 invasion protein B family protein [Pseudomonas sp. WPR_5_2]BCX66960.1 invasion protein [Pseudomonas izuensis]
MMPMDIADLLREALRHSGCMDSQIGHFDSHSTIEMQMKDLPNINVGHVEGEVWVWAAVMEIGPLQLGRSADRLLQILLQGCPWSRSGQLHLCEVEGQLELRLMCNQQALSEAGKFAQALDHFVAVVEELCGILRL